MTLLLQYMLMFASVLLLVALKLLLQKILSM
jgi:hypothetical protein